MRSRIAAVLATAVLVGACSELDTPQGVEVPLYSLAGHDFNSHLVGTNEVPTNASRAVGDMYARLSSDGTQLWYRLVVANITNVTQAHIHCGVAGLNGPIVLWLYPSAPPATLIPGNITQQLNVFTATNANVIPRAPSTSCPTGVADLTQLVALLRTGGAYANVHTQALPGGEVRGQVIVN